MRAVTFTEPWASLIAMGAKTIETRSRNIVGLHRGRIAVHAGRSLALVGGVHGLVQKLDHEEPFARAFTAAGFEGPTEAARAMVERCGCIIATAKVQEIHTTREVLANGLVRSGSLEYAFGDYSPGRVAIALWSIDMVSPPVPARGMLGLWRVPDDIADQVDQNRRVCDPVRL